ncbi:MAG: hypothetical protein HC853_17540 [Anaerolineae bacterium]|nr:hypothetical protein [Anaerolineae bacterium]
MEPLPWREALRDLFPGMPLLPQRKVWTFYDDIVYSLRSIVRHTPCEIFWADTGGSVLKGVEEANEYGCIQLTDGSVGIVKPARLEFESFGEDLSTWAYLRLEAATLELALPLGAASIRNEISEFVAEVYPGKYYHPSVIETQVLGFDANGKPIRLPPSARIVKRYLTGTFLFFSSASKYKVLDEYRGTHIGLNRDAFRTLIQQAVEKLG